jgi:regulator of protease activity HflC (stomatin/prohibitin superfamily)
MTNNQGQQALRFAPVVVVLVVLGIALLRFSPITVIPSGHVGVMSVFGRVTGQALGEGVHLVNPLATTYAMSIRTQELKETAAVPSMEGLIQKVGPNYVGVIIEPTLRSAIRDATAENSATALYTGGRELVAHRILEELRKNLTDRGVVVENVLLREIQLPETLKAAIEAKQRAEQDSLQMQYVLTKEKQEAERKRVEAQGIADFQKIVTQGISEQLLEWKGIEATEKLAASPNTKVIVVGGGKTGLPLILGQ